MAAPHDTSIVASDEKIAHTLQEEFDSEAAMEESNAAIPVINQLQLEAEVWATTFRNLSVGCSTEQRPSPMVDKDHQLALALSETQLQVDRELARRLHDFDSTPHIPRINGVIPPIEVANEDHQRLLDRLSLYGLVECRIVGDGNCQFRALSDQLYRSPEHHKFLRHNIVSQLTRSQCSYSGYVPMSYDKYLTKMTKDGEWGDHITLQTAVDYYGVKISLITSFKDTCFVEIMPAARKSAREIYLSFWAEVHYNSLYPLGEVPKALGNQVEEQHASTVTS